MANEDAADIAEEVDGEIDFAILEGLEQYQDTAGLGAEIDADLATGGPLAQYMVEVRARAVEAIKRFTALDLGNTVAIRDCQDAVRAYLDVMDFLKRSLAAAERAGAVIANELAEVEGNPD